MRYSIPLFVLIAVMASCQVKKQTYSSQPKSDIKKKSPENNKITIVGDPLDFSTANGQKIIFDGKNNEVVLKYMNAMFNDDNSKDVLIIEGDGNKVVLNHKNMVRNSMNNMDTLVIKGDHSYLEILHQSLINNSNESKEYQKLDLIEKYNIIDNRSIAITSDSSIAENKLSKRFESIASIFEDYRNNAILGNPKASFYLGELYQMGVGTEIDIKKAIYYYKIAANKDFKDAQSALGYIYESDYTDSNKDLEKAVYWYKKAAMQNDEYAKTRLTILSE